MSGETVSSHPVELHEPELTPEVVELYLKRHPGFLKNRDELLMTLELSHGSAGSVSLVERQIELLREQNRSLQQLTHRQSAIAEANDTLFAGTRQMVLELLDCTDVDHVRQVIEQRFPELFNVELAALALLSPEDDPTQTAVLRALIKSQRPYCGIFRREEMAALFSLTDAVEGSAALVPLVRNDEVIGVLAVGSRDVQRYASSVGTLFLEHLADVILRLSLKVTDAAA